MKDSQIIDITEKHLSPQVLPKEQASGWIKWKKGVPFEKLILKYEADVQIFRLFNIDEEIFNDEKNFNGKIEIPKSMIQMDGFFGFTAYYTKIPESEREISYEIEIINEDNVQSITLTNTLTRPMIEVEKATPDQIIISNLGPATQPLSLSLKSKGIASLHNLSFFIDFISSDQLRVSISPTKPVQSNVSFSNDPSPSQHIEISGKGNGLIRMGVKYFDVLNTQYTDIVKEIPLRVEQKLNQSVPLSHKINESGTQLLALIK